MSKTDKRRNVANRWCEERLLTHMEHMRMDPKHQFAAQYVLSRAAAERRECDTILAATLAGSTGGNVNSRSAMLPLLDEGGGSNSMCPSPSANSECSSNDRLSAASDVDIHLMANNNKTDPHSNKLNEMLNHTGSNSQLANQYGMGGETEIHLTKRMSLMAAASAAAAAVAASANGVSPGGGINMAGSSVISISSPSTCADSTRSRVQAAVVNLAAAMRINQVNQQQSSANIASGGSTNNIAPSSSANTPIQQILLQPHDQLEQQPTSSTENIQSSVSKTTETSGLRLGISSPNTGTVISSLQSDSSTVNAVVSMTAMRDTMIRTGMSVVDPLNGMLDQHMHSHAQNQTTEKHAQYSDAQNSEPGLSKTHQLHHQEAPVLQAPNPHHHHHINEIEQPHSPERTLRIHQHAEAILRSHTEAAFRLAASAASNGVIGASSILTVASDANISENSVQLSNIMQDTVDAHHIQQQQQQHQPMMQQQQKLSIGGSQQQLTVIDSDQSHISTDLSEAIRFQEQRLEQALRLHSDARALNFLTSPHQNANMATGISTVTYTSTPHQHQQQTLTVEQNQGNA